MDYAQPLILLISAVTIAINLYLIAKNYRRNKSGEFDRFVGLHVAHYRKTSDKPTIAGLQEYLAKHHLHLSYEQLVALLLTYFDGWLVK